MIAGWTVIVTALIYISILFLIAHYGDNAGQGLMQGRFRSTIYALTLAVFCSSWTFYGSVGVASLHGFDFLAIYVGPILLFLFGHQFLRRIIRLSKSQNITSIADFVDARYGKSQTVAVLVSLIAVIGTVPYMALQLKAIASSIFVVFEAMEPSGDHEPFISQQNLSLVSSLLLAGFAAAFGTRHVDTKEHQYGLMLAIAVESLIKLFCFVAVGLYVTYGMFDGLSEIVSRIAARDTVVPFLDRSTGLGHFFIPAFLSGLAVFLLPRQFHVTMVENREEGDFDLAVKLFPLYLIAINLFVVPLTLASDLILPTGANRDMAVLELPLLGRNFFMMLTAFVGGLSAATAMVIVEGVALAIMISNHIAIPLLLGRTKPGHKDMGSVVLLTRRLAILAIMLMGHLYYCYVDDINLASIGMISFAAIAQISPALIGGLIWKRATASGASSGLVVGISIWLVTLFLPSLVTAASPDLGPIPAAWFAPLAPLTDLIKEFGALAFGTISSLCCNVLAYIFVSLRQTTTPMERLQANLFVGGGRPGMPQAFRFWRVAVSIGELQSTVARYLGFDRTQESFANFMQRRGQLFDPAREADIHLMRYAEHQLSSAIGASSSRLVISLLMRRRNVNNKAALQLLDDASAAIQYNRDLFQHALDHARQGITLFDRDLRLLGWNREFQNLFELSDNECYAGVGLDEIIRHNAERGLYGSGATDDFIAARLESFVNDLEPVRVRLYPSEKVVEIRSAQIPDGGIVTTYTDITETVAAEEALERANETLERRVIERTEELTRLNSELLHAKAEAEEANSSKTRFLAAASHDILQPLNAARLYVTALVERPQDKSDPQLVQNIDSALEAVEDILGALLDISRLDAGAMKPEFITFAIDDILGPLCREFESVAKAKNLSLHYVRCSLRVRSDRRLLRRLLQNLISNAIKYTPSGKIIVGCRRRGPLLHIAVIDNGIGIPLSKQKVIFEEFQRLDQGARVARGLGLGLSIVERISRVLAHPVDVRSLPGHGSTFTAIVPISTAQAQKTQEVAQPRMSKASLAGMVVLCIDNEPAILDGMRIVLEGWDCSVLTASNSETARAVMRNARENAPEKAQFLIPDLIIADYHLDDEDGLSVIDKLRQQWGGDIKAILLTADRTPQVRERASLSAVHVMNKPLKPAALRAFMAQLRSQTQ